MSKTVKKPGTESGTKNGSDGNVCKPIRKNSISKFFHIVAMLVLLPEGQLRSGKSGSIVWNKNGVVKKFRKPAVVRNTYTSLVRGTFQTLSSAFRTLGSDSIAAWNAFSLPSKNRIGNTTSRSGKRAYISLNTNLQLTSQTLVTLPPVLTGAEAVELTSIIVNATLGVITLSYTPVSSGTAMIYATAGQSAGISKPSKSKYRLIGVVDMTAASPALLNTAYTAKFGTLNVGENYFFEVRNIAPTGERSAITAISATAI